MFPHCQTKEARTKLEKFVSEQELHELIIGEAHAAQIAAELNRRHFSTLDREYRRGIKTGVGFATLGKSLGIFCLVLTLCSALVFSIRAYILQDHAQWEHEIAVCRAGNQVECAYALTDQSAEADQYRRSYLKELYRATTGKPLGKVLE